MKKLLLYSFILTSLLHSDSISVKNGWQLLGSDRDINITNFDKSNCIDYIWQYDQNNPKHWKLHLIKKINFNNSFEDINIIKKGEGFWAKINSDSCQIDIDNNDSKEISRAEAIRFLKETTFGFNEDSIKALQKNGYEKWIDEQFKKNSKDFTTTLFEVLNHFDPNTYTSTNPNDINERFATTDRYKMISKYIWWKNSLDSLAQLRLRVAYALSQIIVVSFESPAGNLLKWRGEAMAYYFDKLKNDAFKTYKDVLTDITYSPAMAYFMTYAGSAKFDKQKGTSPDENYARELMQRFTIGIKKLNLDGTPILDNKGNFIPTYTQDDVANNARVFTGWFFYDKDSDGKFGRLVKKNYNYTRPIVFHSEYHDYGAKKTLGKTIPANLSGQKDIETLIDILYDNPNIAPFISKKLIKRLTTSNPTPQYVQRVAKVFNDNGKGVKGDLKAVIKAILLDPENLRADHNGNKNFGKVNELVVSFAQTLKNLNVSAPKGWKYQGKVVDFDMYWIASKLIFDQAPLQAPDVFNFYSDDFTPNSPIFKENNLTAPEVEIQTSNILIKYSNELYTKLNYDQYSCLTLKLCGNKNITSMNDLFKSKKDNGIDFFYLDLSNYYHAFEKALDGKVDNNFQNLKDKTKVNNAIKALIDYSDKQLLGGVLPKDYKDKLFAYLKTQMGSNIGKVRNLMTNTILAIVTSPYYITIK